MNTFNFPRWAPCALALLACQAGAAPMGFKDSAMAMGDFGPGWSELYANYAYTPRDALGASVLASPGIQVDYETTRVYLAATGRLYRAKSLNHDYGAVRAGFSFYEAE